jgi:hypothetical protein
MKEHRRLTKDDLRVGAIYLRRSRNGGTVRVRKVLSFDESNVTFEWVYGKPGTPVGRPNVETHKLRAFLSWLIGNHGDRNGRAGAIEVTADDDYTHYLGAIRYETFVCLKPNGEPLFRCSDRRARFYLRKGYANLVGENTIQFTNDTTEEKLAAFHGAKTLVENPFFMSKKNDRCVVCGNQYNLTRHHVIPQRHKKKMSLRMRKNLSNVLFVCWPCHHKYEKTFGYANGQEIEPMFDMSNPYNWRDHFIRTMKPQFMPKGWDIVIKGQNNAERR